MIKYGLISEVDARCLEKTIDLICETFPKEEINVTEIGVYNGATSNGILKYITLTKGRYGNITGVENFKDKEQLKNIPPFFYKTIIGNSNEVYNQIEDNSQHLIFVDGCHCFAHVVSDFFCYAPKVKVGGYMAFHDTGKHIQSMKDYQHGDIINPDSYISVRKALEAIGMFGGVGFECGEGRSETSNRLSQWQLIFDEADETNEAGGVTIFRKLY